MEAVGAHCLWSAHEVKASNQDGFSPHDSREGENLPALTLPGFEAQIGQSLAQEQRHLGQKQKKWGSELR